MQLQLFAVSVLVFIAGFAILISTIFKPARQIRRISYIFIIISSIVFFASALIKVDEGEVLVLTQFGKVYATITTPGIKFKYPWADKHAYPSRLRSKKLSIPVRSLDGMELHIDITAQYKVDPNNVKSIYRNIAKEFSILEEDFIIPELRTSIRDSAAKFSAKGIYSNRIALNNDITTSAKRALASKFTIISNILLREIKLPEQIEEAIRNKIRAQQNVEATEYKKLKSIKEAEIKKIEAEGLAIAQRIINSTLTTRYLQYEAIQAYKELSRSTNKTFVIMPTSAKGTGMPLIIGGQ